MTIVAGSTTEIKFTLTSVDENGVTSPVDLSSVIGLVIYLFSEGAKVVAKYSLNVKDDHDAIDIEGSGTDATNGIGIIRLQSDKSSKAIMKMLKAEFHVFQTNTNFTDNIQHDIVTDVALEVVSEPVVKNVQP